MQYQRGVRLFWPIVLIGVGAILLLNNLGWIHGNPWAIMFQLWPVLLIALGLEVLFGGATGGRAVVSALLGLALVGGVLWILIAQPPLPGLNFGGNLQTTNISQPLDGVETARVDLSFGAGSGKVYALGDSNNLIEGQLRTYYTPNFSVSTAGDQTTIVLSPGRGSVPFSFSPTAEEVVEVGLNSAVTYDLNLNVGVGQSNIDLTKLRLSGGELDGGVGTSELHLPNKGTFKFRINGGVGTIKIYVPSNLEVRAEVDGGLGSFHGLSRLERVGHDVYETPRFSTAENAVTLIIDGGVGSISMYDSE